MMRSAWNYDTGVYIIRNRLNGKVYVGSAASSFSNRWHGHKNSLDKGVHRNRYLQNAWNKHGSRTFQFEVLEVCPPEQCLTKEQKWIDSLESCNPAKGYNINPTAGSNLGTKHTKEVRERIAASKRGKPRDEVTKAKLRETWKNPVLRALLSAKNKGRPGKRPSPETLAKLSAARTGGKRRDETKRRMSLASLGRPKTEDHKARMSAGWAARRERAAKTSEALALLMPKLHKPRRMF